MRRPGRGSHIDQLELHPQELRQLSPQLSALHK
jgi:hypothetical protein